MRSAERLHETVARVGPLVVAAALLSACAAIGGKAAAPGSPASADAPASGAAGKPTQAAAAASSAAGKTAPGSAPVPASIDPSVQRAFDAARQALGTGRTADAERAFTALAKSHPELAGAHANLGLIHRQAGRAKEAVAALERAVELAPQRADLHNQLGIAYRAAGDFARAKASYERSIALDPAYAAAVLNLGILYDLYLWDGARALELYDRYLQMTAGGDEQVKRWVSDLRNRRPKQDAAARKEQG
jgi:Flp pilus assembly protein TadD